MKKVYIMIIILVAFCFMPKCIYAAGNISVSTTNINIYKGSSSSFTITANNAAGRVDVSSSNPGIVSVSTASVFLDMQSEKVTLTANAVGNATIRVYVADATTYDDESLTGKTYVINVKVTEPVVLSKNNNLKNLEVEGYELTKIDKQNYALNVSNDVSSIKITATAEDEKAKVSGVGEHKLNIGENNLEIIVTSESGLQNKIIVKVTRKDGYYLEDLKNLLDDPQNKEISINIQKDSKVTAEQLDMIKNSGKEIKLNYLDENKKVIYSWIVDGQKIDSTNEFLTTILYTSEYKKDIAKLSNYADGVYITYRNNGALPKDVKTKLSVSDKFENDSMVKAYCYDENKKSINLYLEELIVKDGYVELNLNNCSNYFLSMSDISAQSKDVDFAKILVILISVELIAIAICYIKKKFAK